MKTIKHITPILISILMLIPVFLFSQGIKIGSSEEDVVNYLKNHKDILDPIEGIWLIKSVKTTKYRYVGNDETWSDPSKSEMEVVVISLNGSLLHVFVINYGQVVNELGESCTIKYHIYKSAISNRYTFSAEYTFPFGSVQLSVSILFIILGSLVFPCGGMTGGRRPEGRPPQGMVNIL